MSSNKKQDIEAISAVLNQWLTSLDGNNLDGMLETCDPEIIVANENTPTTIGVEHVKNKYQARMAAAKFESVFETEHIEVYGDVALLVGHFNVKAIDRKTGEVGGGSGRLALAYKRNTDGDWKMVFDMDNNA